MSLAAIRQFDQRRLRLSSTKKLREASPVWAEGIASVIQAQRNELKRDSEGLFEIVDWKVVNEVARRSGLPGDYPEPLLSRALAGGDAFEERVSNGLPSGAPRQREGAFSHNLVVMGLPITVGVGAAASWADAFSNRNSHRSISRADRHSSCDAEVQRRL
jgi:hypothetical protein